MTPEEELRAINEYQASLMRLQEIEAERRYQTEKVGFIKQFVESKATISDLDIEKAVIQKKIDDAALLAVKTP